MDMDAQHRFRFMVGAPVLRCITSNKSSKILEIHHDRFHHPSWPVTANVTSK